MISAEPTSDIQAFRAMLEGMDDLYNVSPEEAFTQTFEALQPFEENNPRSLMPIINALKKAHQKLRGRSTTTIFNVALRKLGSVGQSYFDAYRTEGQRNLVSLSTYLTNRYQYMKRVQQDKSVPVQRQTNMRNMAREPGPRGMGRRADGFVNYEDNSGEFYTDDYEQQASGQTYGFSSQGEDSLAPDESMLAGLPGPDHYSCAEEYYAVKEDKAKRKPVKWKESWAKCPLDNGKHFLAKCRIFNDEKTIDERWKIVESQGRCARCLATIWRC